MRSRSTSIVLASTGALGLVIAGLAVTTSQADPLPESYLILETDASGGTFTFSELPGKEERFSQEKNCTVTSNEGEGDPSVPDLADIAAGGGVLGFNDNGFGVKSKGPGTSCGQAADSEYVEVVLGDDVDGPVPSTDLPRLITELEVDIESKFACSMTVEYRRNGSTYDTQTVDLSDRSDCGPDSAGNDNQRVSLVVPGVGASSIRFMADQGGAISLEGGFESTAIPGGLAESQNTDGSVFKLSEGGRIIPRENSGEPGEAIIRDPSGAIGLLQNNNDYDIPYETEPCPSDSDGDATGDGQADPCINFKLVPDADDDLRNDGFNRLTVYVSIPIGEGGAQTTWDGQIDYDGSSDDPNVGDEPFTLGQLSLDDGGCVITESTTEQEACITRFIFPDPEDGSGNPALDESVPGITYRTDIWDVWLSDPLMR